MTDRYADRVDRVVLDPTATDRLVGNVVDLVALLLADRGLEVERLDDGRRRPTALEIVAPRERARVVVHVEPVIA